MDEKVVAELISIKPFEWKDWVCVVQLRVAQLAEHGIILEPDDIPEAPEETGPDSPEWDLDHIDQVYLSGAGGFWLAWCGNKPVGQIGAQDLGGVIELRRMYVRAEYRRRGIGSRLVNALVKHCTAAGVQAIELWTHHDGPGRFLYEKYGFYKVAIKGLGFEEADDRSDQIRMRLGPEDMQNRIGG